MTRDARERVVLVDGGDAEVGAAGKLEAHREGRLHRAFSVFVLNARGEVLLQRRAAEKYHTGGLWSNTCCGHPRPGEGTGAAARRRLREEMGIDCELSRAFGFVYRAELGGGMSEHEYDHVYVGRFEGEPDPDPEGVEVGGDGRGPRGGHGRSRSVHALVQDRPGGDRRPRPPLGIGPSPFSRRWRGARGAPPAPG